MQLKQINHGRRGITSLINGAYFSISIPQNITTTTTKHIDISVVLDHLVVIVPSLQFSHLSIFSLLELNGKTERHLIINGPQVSRCGQLVL